MALTQKPDTRPIIEVCLTPALWYQHDPKGKNVVIIDIIRATSTISAAIFHGVKKMVPVETVEEANDYLAKGFLVAGERDGHKLPHFHFGNSPFEFMGSDTKGKTIIHTTTNGTRCVLMSKGAKNIVAGSFVNQEAIVNWIRKENRGTILFCAGWKEHYVMDDALFAGAVLRELVDEFRIIDDSTLSTKLLYRYVRENMLRTVKMASHFKRLSRLGIEKDIKFCMSNPQYDVVPWYDGEGFVKL
ncbi:MAG: 2-phosphosulfolactate phosphatase [Chitinophagales bacterium]|nr:2-phosphosulfolactate phosphatase [Chitinophagales bacterium]